MKEHLVVVGFDEIVSNKYLEIIEDGIRNDILSGYSIIDLETQKDDIKNRLRMLKTKPKNVYYLNNKKQNQWADRDEFGPVIDKIIDSEKQIKIYIATELKAHEEYLQYCVDNDIKCLVEKPIFSPMNELGRFSPEFITIKMNDLKSSISKNKNNVSIMTLSRYHPIYNDIVFSNIKERLNKYKAPITSLHLRHAGGIWNLMKEYETREDHPYKYGYGMIMHGGYHYIDLFIQFLELNKSLFPDEEFELMLCSFSGFPKDQDIRIPNNFLNQEKKDWAEWEEVIYDCGETDIVTSYCLKNKNTDKVLTVGTISLEQTTPSVRNWEEFPEGVYNKNGRTSLVEIEVQLATLHSLNVQCYDVPVKGVKEVERIDAFAKVLTRSNATLLPDEEYITESSYDGLFHSQSNKALMKNWIFNCENKSTLEQHTNVMKLVQALCESTKNNGKQITYEF